MREGDNLADEANGIGALLSDLASDAREAARAEVALAKARVSAMIARYRAAAILFAVAGVLALAALVALLVGLIETLAPRLGAGGATATVVGVTLVIALLLAMMGRSRLSAPGSRP